MDGANVSGKLSGATGVSGSAAVDIDCEAIFRARRQSGVSERITTLMATQQIGLSVADCVAIVGPPERASREAQRITDTTNRRFQIEVFSDRIVSDEEMGQHSSGTDFDRLTELVRSGQISRILLATPAGECQRIAAILKQLEGMAVDVDLILEGFSTYSRLRFGMAEDVCIARILRKPLTSTQALIKSIIDRIGAFLLLVLITPMLFSIALTVKLTSRGPIIFRQQRFGLNNEVFEVLKFRTLYHLYSDTNAQQTVKRHDERVTPIGKVLRALSLDELPQLLNVLKGDMSFIGPRPLPVGLKVEGKPCSEFPHYRARHRVRPGITGLAQINGWRGGMEVAEDLRKRLACDLAYVDNYSLLMDVKIAIATAFAVLRPTNAY
jgi:exopolysaccharide biosynthesis polyprenyl glycosylphosphotransferase